MNARTDIGDDDERDRKGAEEEEEVEVLLVVVAHAIVDPRTVMIHFENAFGTHPAMMGSVGTEGLTVSAVARSKLDWCGLLL